MHSITRQEARGKRQEEKWRRTVGRCSVALGLMLWPCAAAAAPVQVLPERFTLGRYVPGDWWMYLHFVHNPEHDWLEKEWAEVWDALKKTGLDKDIMSLVLSALSDEDRAQTEATVGKIKELLAGVRWGDLLGREVVFAERVAPPMPEYTVLLRGTEGSGEKNIRGLAEIIKYAASFSPKMQVVEEKRNEVEVCILRFVGVEPFAFHLFRKGDVIGLVTSQNIFDQTMALMAGTGSKPPIVEAPRFQEALREVKAPEDAVAFFDWRLLIADLNGLIDHGFNKNKDETCDQRWLKLFKAGLGLLDVMEYQVVSSETQGRQEFTRYCCKLQADKMGSPLVKMVRNRKPFEQFDKYIPADAKGFSMDTFVDIETVYRTALDFVEKYVPDGAEGVKHWKELLAGHGIDLDRDVFSWLSGEMISIDMPAVVVTPMSDADSVSFLRVKDSKIAAEKLNNAIHGLKAMLEQYAQQTLLITPAGEGLEGFHEVTHPMMAMFLRPVIGVKDEWLIIGTSGKAIVKCMDVAAGKSPSIAKDERFRAEGIVPKGPVCAASFTDTSKTAEELGAALGMAGMIGGFVTAGMPADPGDPEAKKGKEMLQKVFSMLMKLNPVVAKLDFYSSEASVTVWDGPFSRTEEVVTYKPPAGDKNANAAKKE